MEFVHDFDKVQFYYRNQNFIIETKKAKNLMFQSSQVLYHNCFMWTQTYQSNQNTDMIAYLKKELCLEEYCLSITKGKYAELHEEKKMIRLGNLLSKSTLVSLIILVLWDSLSKKQA